MFLFSLVAYLRQCRWQITVIYFALNFVTWVTKVTYCNWSSSVVVRQLSSIVRHVSSVNRFTIFKIYSWKLQGQLLPFLVWSISWIKEFKWCNLLPEYHKGIISKNKSFIFTTLLFYSNTFWKKNAYLRCQWKPLSKLWNSWSLGQGFKEGPIWSYRKVTNVRKFIPLPYKFEKKLNSWLWCPLSPLSKFFKKWFLWQTFWH